MEKAFYVVKRILLACITGFIIISLTFILMKCLPEQVPTGTTATQLSFYNKQVSLGYYVVYRDASLGGNMTLAWTYQSGSTTYYYYVLPIMTQYGNWLRNVFTKWDWGTSSVLYVNQDVFRVIVNHLAPTVEVNAVTVVIAIPIGVALGVWAALKKNKPTDKVMSVVVMVLISIPSFVLISLLIIIFGYTLNWLPTSWPQSGAPASEKALGFVIPVIAGALGSICGYERLVRGELSEALSSDYLLLARTKGLTKSQSVVRHALRNAMVPVLPSILAEIISILSGSAILEQIYSIPGIGQIYINSISARDYNLLMADMTVYVLIGLLAGIVLDLSYGFLDPRIRMGERK